MKKLAILMAISLINSIGFTQNDFTFKFFNKLEGEKNVLFSPTSIKTAFAMAYEGAEGKTQSEFESVFNFEADNSKFLAEIAELKKVAQISNSIWVLENYKILSSYTEKLSRLFNSEPFQTDFKNDPEGSAEKINKWIARSTNDMIKHMVNAADVEDFKLALVNAVYFKQNWKKTFDKKRTVKQKFTNADNSTTEVDMMHMISRFKALDGDHEKVIELPYNDDKTSMLIILPNKMKNYTISNDVFDKLNAKMKYQQVNLDLPKFTFETPTFELKSYLQQMGLTSAFSDDANFSDIRIERDLKIGTALHKAKIIVNEEGTEAAAATVIGVVRTSSVSTRPQPVLKITVDKPFYYFIKDNESNTILFMGQMNKM